jgi:tripartite ATP-independent transporter DctM subunit
METSTFIPLMFIGLLVLLLTGFPVAFSLIATGLGFGFLGIELGFFPAHLFGVLPLRVLGIMQNSTLLAIPFFTFMGIILERSGMAEELLETVGQVFGPLRGGLAVAVLLVGTLLAATTGIVAAAVISMGLISLPVMLRYGYNRVVASGVITASGSLAQVVPPSLVLIVLADQLGRSVGDMYTGALLPALLLVGFYLLVIVFIALLKPSWLPALPIQARIYKEKNGKSGHISLLCLLSIAIFIAYVWSQFHGHIMSHWLQRHAEQISTGEIFVLSITIGAFSTLLLALLNRWLNLHLLSKLAERVTFVLIPPLILIFLVLGTIFLSIATPTEGGAMGAVGALLMAFCRRRMQWKIIKQALDRTTRLSTFVLFILIGSTFFSFTFNAADGALWVEDLFRHIPGGAWGFLITVNLLVFILGMFIDFFEIAFIVVPLLAPVAEKLLPELLPPGVPADIALIWFGVIIAMNLQTSFLTPPFGFSLFYFRSVAPKEPYVDRVTNQTIQAFKIQDIYKGAIVFVFLQLAMLTAVMLFPQLVTSNFTTATILDIEQVEQILNAPLETR